MDVKLKDGRTVPLSDLGGQVDICDRYGWNPVTFKNWVGRYAHAPKPVGRISAATIWVISDWKDFRTTPDVPEVAA